VSDGAETFSYYPGCTGHGTAIEYDLSTRAVCAALQIPLVELDDWTCCGASSAHALSEELGLRLAGRNVELARKAGRDLVVGCAACFNRLRAADLQMRKEDPAAAAGTEVCSLLDLLATADMVERIAAQVTRPLQGVAAVPYYGCLLVRPPEITGADDPEDPKGMDRILAALGADVRRWPYKTRCCGAGLSVPRSDLVQAMCDEIASMARRCGASLLVTACPMCFANLDTRQSGEHPVPVAYFTELIGLALELPGAEKWLGRHLTPLTLEPEAEAAS